MRLRLAIDQAGSILAAGGIDQPRREARLIAAHLLGLSGLALPDPDAQIDPDAYFRLVARRAAHEPMAYISGRRGFWTLDLAVSAATLIPRPDSETLIEAARACFPDRAAIRRVLDLGTGTGCLLLAALVEFPASFGVGVDLSADSAALASRNASENGLAARAAFLAGDWSNALAGRFDLVLANPPYIPAADIDRLMPEVARHEPRRALDGGPDGLDAYRQVVALLPGLLAPGGAAILELGIGQLPAVRDLATRAGFSHVSFREDLGGVPRALVVR